MHRITRCTVDGKDQGVESISRCHLTGIGNPIVEIRRSYDRLISTMGFPILVRWHSYIEPGPREFLSCILGLLSWCPIKSTCWIRNSRIQIPDIQMSYLDFDQPQQWAIELLVIVLNSSISFFPAGLPPQLELHWCKSITSDQLLHDCVDFGGEWHH